MVHMQGIEAISIQAPTNTTAATTSGYVDLQAIGNNHGNSNIAFLLAVSPGTTAGTAGGSIVAASDTAGTGVATVATFSGTTSAGGYELAYANLNPSQRYVAIVATVQGTKDMNVGALVLAPARHRP